MFGSTFLYLFVLLIIAQIKYSNFLKNVRKTKPDYKEDLGGLWVGDNGGKWIAGTYHFRTPLPIALKTKNVKIQNLIDSHDKTIKIFWVSACILLPTTIIIANLIDGK